MVIGSRLRKQSQVFFLSSLQNSDTKLLDTKNNLAKKVTVKAEKADIHALLHSVTSPPSLRQGLTMQPDCSGT